MFDLVQRLYHWGTTAAFVGAVVTGFALYDPFTFEPVADAIRVPLHSYFPQWVTAHVILSSALGGLLLLHLVWDIGKLRATKLMLPTRQDFRDAASRAQNFLFVAKSYPRMGKYDFFMKSFHIYLAISFAVLALTGLYQYFFASWWSFPWWLHDSIEPFWRPTALHDIFGFLLIALVLGHLYFAMLPVNRPLLSAIVNGILRRDEAERRYRTDEIQ